MDIQIDRFKDYKVVKDPKSAQLIDSSINIWMVAIMMDGQPCMIWSVEDFREILPSWSGIHFILKELDIHLSFKKPSEISNKLQGVFDFIEKKEGKANPLKAEAESKEIFSDLKALYPGKLGFGYINDEGKVETFPYPVSGLEVENDW